MEPSQDDTGRGERLAVLSLVAACLGLFPISLVLAWTARKRLGSRRGFRWVVRTAAALSALEAFAFLAFAGLLFLHDPLPSRKRAALDQLRKIRIAQEAFKRDAVVDQDGDGKGEYGFLPELALGSAARANSGAKGKAYVSGVFALPEPGGYVEKYGYYFVVFLPGSSWRDGPKPPAGKREFIARFAQAQERRWIAYAWPAVAGKTASGALAADGTGIYISDNLVARFDGEPGMPAPHAALNGTGLEAVVPVVGTPSLCGELWTRVE